MKKLLILSTTTVLNKNIKFHKLINIRKYEFLTQKIKTDMIINYHQYNNIFMQLHKMINKYIIQNMTLSHFW